MIYKCADRIFYNLQKLHLLVQEQCDCGKAILFSKKAIGRTLTTIEKHLQLAGCFWGSFYSFSDYSHGSG